MTIATLPAVWEIRWHPVRTVPGTEPEFGGLCSVNKVMLSDQGACCPALLLFQLQTASQGAINAGTRWLPSSGSGHICEGFESKSNVCKNNQIPLKPNYLHCLLIALLLLHSPSNKLGSDLRYRSGKAGPCVCFCVGRGGISCIMHPDIQRGPGWPPALSFPLYLPSLSIKSFIMVRVPFIACINKIWQNCK